MQKRLSWIAVVPGALGTALIGRFIIGYIGELWRNISGWWPWLHSIDEYLILSFQSYWEVIIFIVAGMYIAPDHKRKTGVFLIATMITAGLTLTMIHNYRKTYVYCA